jgi:ABC-type antimicrobial peptide transport system permease subunit
MVSIAVALTVAASFIVTAATDAMMQDLSRRLVSAEPQGLALAEEVSRRASSSFVGISILALLISGAAISCVLAVAFLGRKRSLGVLKVLGGTSADLRRLFMLEIFYVGGAGIPIGTLLGLAVTVRAFGPKGATFPCFLISAFFGLAALALGIYLPLRLIRNGSCDQLLNNRPVYAATNPSCAKCGLCGGF